MLRSLHIRGLAVIESLSIDFESGFNVITGETGAGKSILIKALSLLLGGKGSAEAVRKGFDLATISGEFELDSKHPAMDCIRPLGIPCDDDVIIVRRQINSKGRSAAWINDVPVTLASLKGLGEALIDIFGQHETHRLLEAGQHLRYLDCFLPNRTVVDRVSRRFRSLVDNYRQVKTLVEHYRLRDRDRDYLNFRCRELDEFAPSQEDFQQVYRLCQSATRYHTYREKFLAAKVCLEEGFAGESLSKGVWEVSRLIGELEGASENLEILSDHAAELANQLEDLSYQLERSTNDIDVDESELESAQSRLAGYQDLLRKLSVNDVDALLKEHTRLRGEIATLDSTAAEMKHCLRQMIEDADELDKLNAQLTDQRLTAAKAVKKNVEAELHQLAMGGARIEIEFAKVNKIMPTLDLSGFDEECTQLYARAIEAFSTSTESGADRVQLLLAANPGEPAYPLQNVASGGEMARVMLALKRVLAVGADSCLLVFDEIDTGISGKVADVVGGKLKDLAERFQVICISHLAQVAAYADTHFVVMKYGVKERTQSEIRKLSEIDSTKEIARLLSGTEVTSQSLENARTLMNRASLQ